MSVFGRGLSLEAMGGLLADHVEAGPIGEIVGGRPEAQCEGSVADSSKTPTLHRTEAEGGAGDDGGSPEPAGPAKICCGCGRSSYEPSPVCNGRPNMHDWDYNNYSGSWCKHCAAVARLRFLPDYGSMRNIADWVASDTGNMEFFADRLLAYISLRLDPTTGIRITAASIEARVTVLSSFRTWQRCGASVGLPKCLGVGTAYLLRDCEALFGNPFIKGGSAMSIWSGGRYSIVVAMPASSGVDDRASLQLVVPDGEAQGRDYRSIMSDDRMGADDEEAIGLFKKLADEYFEHKAATAALNQQGAGSSSMAAVVLAESSSMALVPLEQNFTPKKASSCALVPFSSKSKSNPNSMADLEFDCGGDSTADDATTTTTKLKRSPPGKSKVDKLLVEMRSKFGILAQEEWASLSCDKNIEGLIKRGLNVKAKALEECDTENSSILAKIHSDLNLIYVFGQQYKKQARKKDESQLITLVQSVRDLKGSKELSAIKWSPSLRLLKIQVEFWAAWGDSLHKEAFAMLEADRIIEISRDIGDNQDERVAAIRFILPLLEKVLIDQVKNLRQDKKQQAQSLQNFSAFFSMASAILPKLPSVSMEFGERPPCRRLCVAVPQGSKSWQSSCRR